MDKQHEEDQEPLPPMPKKPRPSSVSPKETAEYFPQSPDHSPPLEMARSFARKNRDVPQQVKDITSRHHADMRKLLNTIMEAADEAANMEEEVQQEVINSGHPEFREFPLVENETSPSPSQERTASLFHSIKDLCAAMFAGITTVDEMGDKC
jgi:hypothetical protein